MVVWSARFLVANALITGFNPVPDHLFLYGRQAVMWVILMISPTPGGSGIAEYIFPQFFGVFIAGDIADIVALLWRTTSYYPYLLIGTLILPFWYQRVRDKKQQHIKKPSL
ncbi:MAG: flippase-like domain-containing protein [Bacteroidales bacterium]|nr:flippase-like domain-containing protein [Bacteroidales bacterium]